MSVPRDALYECIHCLAATVNPAGVCQFCQPHPATDRLVEQYAPKTFLRFPLDPSTKLPCQDHQELFGRLDTSKKARSICSECPPAAREWCLENALANGFKGTYGGTSTEEREAIKRERMEKEEEYQVEPDELCTAHECKHGWERECDYRCLTHRQADYARARQQKYNKSHK